MTRHRRTPAHGVDQLSHRHEIFGRAIRGQALVHSQFERQVSRLSLSSIDLGQGMKSVTRQNLRRDARRPGRGRLC